MINPTAKQELCDRIALGAYVDGELDDSAGAELERHLEICSACRAELRAHQAFLCELDAAMTEGLAVPVPESFSRVVAARATSEMGGLRSSAEHRKALFFCVALTLVAFSLLGSATRQFVFIAVQRIISKVGALADVFWTALYDLAAGAVVISRVISRKFVVESGSLSVLLVLLAFAILLLSRLISNYHRTRAVD